jgi:hypothetical protein
VRSLLERRLWIKEKIARSDCKYASIFDWNELDLFLDGILGYRLAE